eukprot:gene178-154_t
MDESRIARNTFEIENNIQPVSGDDLLYRYDGDEQDRIYADKPWTRDERHFKKVKLSAVALVKMVMHARSGGDLEIMGLMQGKVLGDTFIIMDAFRLPVEGTETRVNAQAEAYEYMTEFMEYSQTSHRKENICGWYHSHPGYGCWMSGIDVGTQKLNQQFQEPWLAIVIEPIRTCSAGRVDIGAFRTYPQDYVPPDDKTNSTMAIPLEKVEDFGVHYKEYYDLPIEMFKSSQDAQLLDLLWNQYWIDTLSSAPLKANAAFSKNRIQDAVSKLEKIDISSQAPMRLMMHMDRKQRGQGSATTKKEDQPLTQVALDVCQVASDQLQGLSNVVVKQSLFHAGYPTHGMNCSCTQTKPRLFVGPGANGHPTNGIGTNGHTNGTGGSEGMDVG